MERSIFVEFSFNKNSQKAVERYGEELKKKSTTYYCFPVTDNPVTLPIFRHTRGQKVKFK